MPDEKIIALSNKLRDEGVNVSIRTTKLACDVYEIMQLTNSSKNLKLAFKSVYVKDSYDEAKFNKIYDDLFKETEKLKQPPRDLTKKPPKKDKDKQKQKPEKKQDPEKIKTDEIKFNKKPKPKEKPKPKQISFEEIIFKQMSADLQKRKTLKEKEIPDADITQLNQFDEKTLEVCRKLGKKIANRRMKRQKKANKNKISIQKTIRKNLKNGGKLIDLQKAKPPLDKSKHVFLNDISGSCDWISSWFFSIIYGCQRSFRKVTTYEFDSQIIDISEELKTESYYRTYQSIMDKRKAHGMRHEESDMTQSFKQFLNQAPLNYRTVVIILTDCRDWKSRQKEGLAESAVVLRKIVEKTQRVLIFNPEPKENWKSHTSCVDDYIKVGAEVHEVKNLKNLARLIEDL
ncbi:MAG: VWA domain-containing protein [Methanosphaera sp.]|uniref:VWA domain-containing protein n=1 Tax=Methanosphaera sp. TaxID=2666342 RepID=UPI0025CDEFDC|nr:VWA domain-containing protein [Methanosphaera sp.]MCI5867601.1 VWA domain-containing protein [Methanosphaera sp.]MDD6534068.1 VWA domain-containing protein [Methanosphaera sp.]MDY3956122.1 VWA domain-containing protein [Methanosphaera sp.]